MRSAADRLARELDAAVEPIEHGFACHNQHFRVTTPTGFQAFAKLLDDAGYWRRAIAAAELAEPVLPGTPRLLEHGEMAGNGEQRWWWLLYAWHDLTPFVPTPARLDQLGVQIGRLHQATRGVVAGFDRHDLDTEITTRAADLAALDPATAERITALHTRFGLAELPPSQTGLIHGDLHFNNVCLDSDGAPVLVDLDNMAAAHPLLEFGKLLDLGQLEDPVLAGAFAAGYHHETGSSVLPWPEVMRSIRLWIAAGVLVYALGRGDTAFAAHGYQQLAALDTR